MILDRTLSMRCPSVRQSSAIHGLVEVPGWIPDLHISPSTALLAQRRYPRPRINARREMEWNGPMLIALPFSALKIRSKKLLNGRARKHVSE
ncbi:hypothetical protein PQR53_17700 [Paraburkholderia fungorum]|uniref:hypothetical protein n=1 Tax=Paraburkholderia fungorum TaxID=134537 RepID=UPI0038BC5D8F